MKDLLHTALVALAILAIIAGTFWYELSMWQECRVDHSWLYCWRTLHP